MSIEQQTSIQHVPELADQLCDSLNLLRQSGYTDCSKLSYGLELCESLVEQLIISEILTEKNLLALNAAFALVTESNLHQPLSSQRIALSDKLLKLKLSWQNGRDGKRVPGILIISSPRAATFYVQDIIAEQLGIGLSRFIDNGPTHISNLSKLEELHLTNQTHFLCGASVCQCHVPATDFNLDIINRNKLSILLILRDPRQSLLSFLHHNDKGFQSGLYFIDGDAFLNTEYFKLTFAEKVSWLIEHLLPILVKWISGWSSAIADGKLKSPHLLLTFEQMKEDEVNYFQRIWDFYNISPGLFPQHVYDKTHSKAEGRVHWRSGRTDEWKEVMTKEQQQSVISSLSPQELELMRSFGWEY